MFYRVKGTDTWIHSANMSIKQSYLDALPSLDTGGYTGEWDSSGRLAMLH